ncbi:hypothetical protein PM082_003907 [Marasmius tenuissimus]|nr:hypothetical protein PM082_003907 [Marasmius tenuissimus]
MTNPGSYAPFATKTPCPHCKKLYTRVGNHTWRCPAKLQGVQASKRAVAIREKKRHIPPNDPESPPIGTQEEGQPLPLDLPVTSEAPGPEDSLDLDVPVLLEEPGPSMNARVQLDLGAPEAQESRGGDDIPLSGRPLRQTKLPGRFDDFVMLGDEPLQRRRSPSPPPVPSPSRSPSRSPSPPAPAFISLPNNAGLFRIHRHYQPLNDVALAVNPEESPARSPDRVFGRISSDQQEGTISAVDEFPAWHPHPNPTVAQLMKWHHVDGHSKSKGALDRLVHNVILQPDFDIRHLQGFSAQRETDRIYNHNVSSSKPTSQLPFEHYDGWIKGEVEVKMPRARNRVDEEDAPTICVDNVWYRKPYDVIKTEMNEPYTADFHLKPYKLFWQHPKEPSKPIQRVYGESYTSDMMLGLETEIMKKLHPRPEGSPEVGIIGIILYSDSTQLANFGEASLWPAYLTFGNWSKYSRLKPSSLAMNHIIYFPSLPKTVQEHYHWHFDKMASDAELRFCKVELFHAVWHLLISDERFVKAYTDGDLQECADGIRRLLFYRFLFYTADYVEKVLLACIKYLSTHPCPLCLTTKDKVHLLGTKLDMKRHSTSPRTDNDEVRTDIKKARAAIFDNGYSINNEDHVQVHLEGTSILAVQSAFSKVFQPHGLNHYEMFVPDSFHDLTGRISDLLKHNIRILAAKKKRHIEYLDARYRQVPPFGNGTIRRFKSKVSNFSKFAGRDYQDALECALPCWEGLFPDDLDSLIQDLLFTFATYERYCNLRQHTDSTIGSMKTTTTQLGDLFRQYKRAISPISTVETEHELQTRLKRDPKGDREARKKTFSLVNYKTHALGHAADAIVMYGTTDGTSTQAGEREHKRVKEKYQVTNKNKPEGQIAALITVQHKTARAASRRAKLEPIPPPDPSLHHQLPQNQNNPMEFHLLLNPKNPYDAPLKGFKSKLQRHLIARICDMDPDLVSDSELYQLSFVGGRFYRHQRFRLYYTSYDCRRKKESIGFRRRPHIMMLTGDPSDPHPYLYARVIGIYHANVLYLGEDPTYRRTRRMEFLFVRWLQFDESHQWGWKAKRLPRVHFLNAEDPEAFGFVDPAQVIRASHMIPAFEWNTTSELLPSNSIVRVYEEYHENKYDKEDEDWRYYYVNIFPDTDMFMRYRGGGIGHVEFHEFLRRLEEEATENDIPLPEYDDYGDVARVDEVEDDMDEDEEDDDGEEETFEEMFNRAMAGWDEDSDEDDGDNDRDSNGEDSGSDNE